MSADSAGTSSGGSASGRSLNGTMAGWAAQADGNPLLAFIDSCLRGIGQVCFMNNPITGLAILVAMFLGEAWLGLAGALGVVASTRGCRCSSSPTGMR